MHVIGGGVAGTCAAVALARGGVRVVQWAAPERRDRRPPEVLSPGARALLGRLGFSEPSDGTVACEGVLSGWSGDEPEYYDYGFHAGMPALVARRSNLLAALATFADGAGVLRQTARWPEPRSGADDSPPGPQARSSTIGGQGLGRNFLLVASGRSVAGGDRIRRDAMVALRVPFRFHRHGSRLVVEASSNGWWYAVPTGDGTGTLCFMTDADLLPSGRSERRDELARLFRATRLLQDVSEGAPDFAACSGTDAHFGISRPFAWDGGARIGEAALSLDPLSGTGVVRAAESGLAASRDILETGRVGCRYSQFMSNLADREEALRCAAYGRAWHRFRGSPFWQRRAGSGRQLPDPQNAIQEISFSTSTVTCPEISA